MRWLHLTHIGRAVRGGRGASGSELQGYHAHIDSVIGASGASPIYALAGCTDFDDANARRCGEKERPWGGVREKGGGILNDLRRAGECRVRELPTGGPMEHAWHNHGAVCTTLDTWRSGADKR